MSLIFLYGLFGDIWPSCKCETERGNGKTWKFDFEIISFFELENEGFLSGVVLVEWIKG